MAWKIRKGDTVVVTVGKSKGHVGKVARVVRDSCKVVVEGANFVIRHVKPSYKNPEGGRVEKEAPIHISNVALVDSKTGSPTRVGFRFDGDKKVRYSKKTGEAV
ncbi:50S ribosomal protein L24 [Candidatus Hydrogenosomobacter endosymbioticus]|uniref:Large ribosomal subunit protein uL24 n=1 Tax=Candidatus Hydrogenosomobacter endosymbioticus TaxID=2558174 RepID=A0ABN6L3M9_9PROT|nr:50S ribosomal protein L24 [Candidatus Hydrogenosomobacter endosymbioticus]BDB96132.1 50S ribosomal protein L24 [Candidatus Hydrogenosomobacter endosymbioticus]